MRPARILLALALVIAGAGEVSADRYSRKTCKKLKVEYADVLARGIGSDLKQGPEWAAQADLGWERLRDIEAMIDLEADLEFRCRMSRKRIASIKPERKPVIPEIPVRKELPDPPSETANAEADAKAATQPGSGPTKETAAIKADAPAGAQPGTKSQAQTEAKSSAKLPPKSGGQKEAKAKSAVTKSHDAAVTILKPPANSVSKPQETVAKPQAPAAQPAAKHKAAATKPAAKVATQEPAKPAPTKKKKKGKNAYISPREVAPFSLYQNGARW